MKIKIGNKLLSLRKVNNMNQLDFSEYLGVSASAYARIERNETQATYEQLLRFSNILKITIHDFFPEDFILKKNEDDFNIGINSENNIFLKDEYCKKLELEICILNDINLLLKNRLIELIDFNNILKDLIIK